MASNTRLRLRKVRKADTLNDQRTDAQIAGIVATAITEQDIQDGYLSQIKRIIFGNDAGNWYSDFIAAGTKSLKFLSSFAATLTSTIFPAAVTKSAAVIGVSTEAARADHKHDAVTAAPAVGIGAGNAEGAATSLARSDHGHALRETSGPSDLTIGAVTDGRFIKRVGLTLVSSLVEALSPLNKGMVALVTTSDGDLATATALFSTPPVNAWIMVIVNGVQYRVGNGTKLGVPCYFSGDGGVTARATGALAAGDFIYWNGTLAFFQLDGSDRIDFEYEAL